MTRPPILSEPRERLRWTDRAILAAEVAIALGLVVLFAYCLAVIWRAL